MIPIETVRTESSAAMRFEAYWFDPVAVVRPLLLVRGLLVVLAADLWTTRLAPGASYGLGALEVPHFAFFDPSRWGAFPDLYFASVLLAGFAALVAAVTGSRAVLAAVLVLYTASWSMSARDLFQHHYFLSIVLACAVFLPRTAFADVEPRGVAAQDGPLRSAPAFVLLGVSVGLVYGFAAIAKLDAEWLSGATLAAIAPHATLAPLLESLASLGVSERQAWRTFALLGVLLEALLAVAYFTARARERRRAARSSRTLVFAAALLLHTTFEIAGLEIGWFSTYMIGLAAVFFLPARWLLYGALGVAWGSHRLAGRLAGIFARRRWPAVGAVASVVGAAAIAMGGAAIDLPGSRAAGVLAGTSALLLPGLRRIRGSSSRGGAKIAVFACGLAMPVVVGATDVRYRFYSVRVEERLKSRDIVRAREDFEKLVRYAPHRARPLGRIGEVAARLGDDATAQQSFRAVLAIDADDVNAATNLAWLIATSATVSDDDAHEALDLAEHAAALTHHRDANVLDTLAAAQAANGAFGEAHQIARSARARAREQALPGLVRGIEERLLDYERGERFVR